MGKIVRKTEGAGLTYTVYPVCDGSDYCIYCNTAFHRVHSLWFLPCNAMLSAVYATPIPSVRLSVTRMYCIKTAEHIIKILSPSDRPIILVFRHQGTLHNSEGVTPNGGAKYKGVAIFGPICGCTSETVGGRGIVTIEGEYKVVCALSNGAAFNDSE